MMFLDRRLFHRKSIFQNCCPQMIPFSFLPYGVPCLIIGSNHFHDNEKFLESKQKFFFYNGIHNLVLGCRTVPEPETYFGGWIIMPWIYTNKIFWKKNTCKLLNQPDISGCIGSVTSKANRKEKSSNFGWVYYIHSRLARRGFSSPHSPHTWVK